LSFHTHAARWRTVLHRLESPTTGALARNVDGDLESLCATPAWRHVKTKREMLRLRAKLAGLRPRRGGGLRMSAADARRVAARTPS
jgi:hypothetical protein